MCQYDYKQANVRLKIRRRRQCPTPKGLFMPIQPTSHIWHNGQLIPWDKAQIHVMSHVIHYGSSVFEGIRCYTQQGAAAIFRLPEHMRRMLDSAKIYRMPLPYTVDQLSDAVVEVVEANGVAPCYIRPFAFRGYGEIGVNPLKSPVEVYIANFPWGKYVQGDTGADVCVSSWNRLAPNTMPSLAKAGANYMNSQLIRMEADINGYDEGIALDRQRLPLRGLRRKPLPHPRRHRSTLHPSPTPSSTASPATPSSFSPASTAFPSSSNPFPARCSTSATKPFSPEPPPKSPISAP